MNFINSDCGHVATGDVTIFKTTKLIEVLKKGPGYHEPVNLNFEEAYKAINVNISNLLNTWSDKEHFPVELADFLADQVDYILQGKIPAPIKDMARRGSPGVGPAERRNFGVAIAYIHAAEIELIEDKHPVKTIADIYGVTKRAVHYWKAKYRKNQSDFFPSLDGAELIVSLALSVKAAGLRYQKEGRGSKGRVSYPRPNKQ